MVSYTLTIEQTGGSGIVVPGRGFLLNNELTDFTYSAHGHRTANRIAAAASGRGRRWRRRSCCATAGRSWRSARRAARRIITTVLQTLVNRIDLGLTLPEAVEAPRASNRNTVTRAPAGNTFTVTAEPAFIDAVRSSADGARLHASSPAGTPSPPTPEIGAVAALEFYRGGLVLAVAERTRRGGGSAGVVHRIR